MKHINKEKVTKTIGIIAVGTIAFAAGIKYSEFRLDTALTILAYRGKTITFVSNGFEHVISLSATPIKD